MSEQYEWPVLPLSAEILHLDDDMLKAVLVEIRANVRAAVQAAQPEAVGLTDNDLERIFEDAGGKWNGDMWTIEDADFHPAMRSLLASTPTPEPMSAPTAEAVATARPSAEWYAKKIQETDDLDNFLPCGALATPPSAATPEPSDAERLDAARWRAFIGLDYALRAEWATNLSLAPILTKWVDNSIAAMTETKGGK